ncbi:MAG: trypsin-like peptidase domain-containing protein [Chloroflexota bacterium]
MGALAEFSDGLAAAVERAGGWTVLVDARKRYPASGIAMASDLVLTADHVVTRDANLSVRTAEGTQLAASIAGRDPGSDLAVLRLNEKALTPAVRATSPARVGQLVLAMGRPDEAGIQASWGIVTARGGPSRTSRGGLLDKYVQTETTPYPGFSGGPLVDTEGKVLGLNTSGLTPGSALTIPVEVAWPIGEALAKDGSVKRGYLGVRTQAVALPESKGASGRDRGLLVVWLEENGPAASAGALVGDILTGISGRPVRDPDDIFAALTSATVGKPIEVEVLRGGKPQSIRVVVGERK